MDFFITVWFLIVFVHVLAGISVKALETGDLKKKNVQGEAASPKKKR